MNFLTILFMMTWWCLASNLAIAGGECNSWPLVKKNTAIGVRKHLGSTFNFTCKSKCSGSGNFSFFHYNHVTEKHDLIFESSYHTHYIPLASFNDGGEYCCSKQCGNKPTAPSTPDCCTRIKISPVVEWNLPKAVGLHGAPIKGSCSVTAYPRPSVMVITPFGCKSQQKSIHIGRHTNKVEFTIHNATKRCEEIHCFIRTFGELNTTELLIVENVLCGDKKRQTRSATPSMLTELQRGESIITSRRLNIEDHNDETYATRNSNAITSCNMLMIPVTLILASLFI